VRDLRRAPAKVRFLSVESLLEDLGEIDLSGITWVIVGGESGSGARPMRREWVVSIRQQCREQGVAFFFKQWGGVRKAKNGRLLDGRTYDEYPERILKPVPEKADCLAWAAKFGKGFPSGALALM
jgi:protein gp37